MMALNSPTSSAEKPRTKFEYPGVRFAVQYANTHIVWFDRSGVGRRQQTAFLLGRKQRVSGRLSNTFLPIRMTINSRCRGPLA